VAHEGKACEVGSLAGLVVEGKVGVSANANAVPKMHEVELGVLYEKEVAIWAHGRDTSITQAKETCLLPYLPQEVIL